MASEKKKRWRYAGRTVPHGTVITRVVPPVAAAALPVHGTCSDCHNGADRSVGIAVDGALTCKSCGLHLGVIYADGLPQSHADVDRLTDDRVHAQPAQLLPTAVLASDGKGMVAVLSEDLSTTAAASSKGKRKAMEVSPKTGANKRNRVEKATNAMRNTRARFIRDVGTLCDALSIESTKVRERIIDMGTQFIITRGDFPAALRSTGSIATVLLIWVSCSLGVGVRREVIVRSMHEPRFTRRLSHWRHVLASVLPMPPVDRGTLLMTWVETYISRFDDLTPVERRMIRGVAGWVRCMLTVVQRLPAPLDNGKPYLPMGAKGKPSGSRHRLPASATAAGGIRALGRLFPDNLVMSRMARKSLGHGMQWFHRIATMAMAIDTQTPEEIDAHWVSKLPSSLHIHSEPLPVPTPRHEWPIRRFAPSTIAAVIIWLVTQMRPPASNASTVPKPTEGKSTPKRRKSKVPAHLPGIGEGTEAGRSQPGVSSYHRLTQADIYQATYVGMHGLRMCAAALYTTVICLT